MGRVANLRTSRQVRLWFMAVMPSAVVLLIITFVLRAFYRARVSALLAAGTVPTPDQLDDALSGGLLILGGVVLSAAVTSLNGMFVNRKAIRPYRTVSRVARELAAGNYTARAEVSQGGSELFQELTTSINLLADALERTERLRRELVANLAHEIRTPLTNLQGYLEALRDGVIEPNQEALISVHEEVMRLVRLVDALHQLARADALRQQPMELALTELDSLVERLVRVVKPNADLRRVQLLLDLGARCMLAPVHADSIAQVMRNLLKNAVQYTPDGGVVQVQTSGAQGFYRFVCLNSGPGIAPEDLPFIFNRFYRTERATQGSGGVGIGLAICKELVEVHGGRIGAESKPGWTSVWFEVPTEPGNRLDSAS